jgi:Spy/CpxP family protein refolding chaperone
MKQKTYHVVFPTTLAVVMVVFLAAIFFANAGPSFAASDSKKSSAVVRTSAVDHAEAQKELWNNLTNVMRENAKDMDAFTKDRAESTKTMNSVERMKFHSQITKAQYDQLEKLIPTFEALYSSMSDQQKNITDIVFRTGKHGKSKKK